MKKINKKVVCYGRNGIIIRNEKINSKDFFVKAGKASRSNAIKAIINLHKEDGLSKKIKEMVSIDDSYVKQYLPDIYSGVAKTLKDIANNRSVLEKEIYDKTSGLINCIIKDVSDKNLSQKQRNYLNVLKSYMEDISFNSKHVLDIVENCVIARITCELHKYFKNKQQELNQPENYYVAVAEDISKEYSPAYKQKCIKEDNKYKYIKEDMKNIFFDKLKESMKGKVNESAKNDIKK